MLTALCEADTLALMCCERRPQNTSFRRLMVTVEVSRIWFEWWGAGVVICLERGADLHIAQLMPLPLTVSCFSKIQIGFTFLVPAHLGSPGKGPLNVCVCVCVC